jgi:hypothetical protein
MSELGINDSEPKVENGGLEEVDIDKIRKHVESSYNIEENNQV